jgi:uncharacterized protein
VVCLAPRAPGDSVRPRRHPTWVPGPSTSPLEVSRRGAVAHIGVWRTPHTRAILSAVSPSFEWDPAKDAQNQRKHGVAFADAQLAFLDPARVIAKDLSHSKGEERFYCFGEVGGDVVTVRFTYRGKVIRIFGAGYWRRGKTIYEAQSKVPR